MQEEQGNTLLLGIIILLIVGGGSLIWYVVSQDSTTPEEPIQENQQVNDNSTDEEEGFTNEEENSEEQDNATDEESNLEDDEPVDNEEETEEISEDTEDELENDFTGSYTSFSVNRYTYDTVNGVFQLDWEISKASSESLNIVEQLNENELTLTFKQVTRDSMIKAIKENSDDDSCSVNLADKWIALDSCEYSKDSEESTYRFTLSEGREYDIETTGDSIVLNVQ
jgi:cytoskeletal protein RodZ